MTSRSRSISPQGEKMTLFHKQEGTQNTLSRMTKNVREKAAKDVIKIPHINTVHPDILKNITSCFNNAVSVELIKLLMADKNSQQDIAELKNRSNTTSVIKTYPHDILTTMLNLNFDEAEKTTLEMFLYKDKD